MTVSFSYPADQGSVEIEATVSRDGEAGSLSVPWGWYVDELVARRDGKVVELTEAERRQAMVEAVPMVMQWPFEREIEFSISTNSS